MMFYGYDVINTYGCMRLFISYLWWWLCKMILMKWWDRDLFPYTRDDDDIMLMKYIYLYIYDSMILRCFEIYGVYNLC